MMKVKYVGPSIGVTGVYNGKIYEVNEIDSKGGFLRVIDEDQSDWNYDNDPDWKPGYLYSATAPRPLAVPTQKPGRFFIVEDEDGQLEKAGVLPLPKVGDKEVLGEKEYIEFGLAMCPLVGELIDCVDCMENQDVIDESVPDRFKRKSDWRVICDNCEFRDY